VRLKNVERALESAVARQCGGHDFSGLADYLVDRWLHTPDV